MGAEYKSLLFYTSVRWLSKVDMLIRLVRLLPEVTELIEIQHKKELKAVISNLKFQNRLAFLADMFCHLNELNRKLQGVAQTCWDNETTLLLLSQSLEKESTNWSEWSGISNVRKYE